MSEQILIPVKIEALIVDKTTAGDTAENWKSFSIDYDALNTRLGNWMEPVGLKQLQQGGFCEKGIHLHWALPSALTNGIHTNNKTIFPAVPNRWLVIRTHLVNGKPVFKKWILESDYLSPLTSDKSTWAIRKEDGSYDTSYNIGKLTVLDNWTVEQPRSQPPLTAIGPGNATFAAIYQHCRNVFGFWDDLTGLVTTATVFSYHVTGWYSDAAIEPLQYGHQAIIDNLKSKWIVDGQEQPENFPNTICCHGFIHSVAWNPAQEYALPVRSAEVNTGVGMTSVEAKTAQLSRQTGAAEKLMNTYLYDGLKDVVDATVIETLVGNHAFTAYDGGTLWEIKRVEKETKAADKQQELPNFPDTTQNPGLSKAYQLINEEQQRADKIGQQLKSLKVEFRALCDKIIMAQTNEDKVLEAKLVNSRNLLKNDIDVAKAALARHEAEVTQQESLINAMAAFVAPRNGQAEFELVKKKMPRYWQPNDPAVLFSGPGITPSTKYKNPGNKDKLPCRTVSKIVAGILLNEGDTVNGKTIAPVNIDLALKPVGSLQNNIDIINKLYKEAILLDPNWAVIWGMQYYKDSLGDTINAQKLGEYLQKVLLVTTGAPTDKFKGLVNQDGTTVMNAPWSAAALTQMLETRGVQLWKHPWTPLYMIWFVKFAPSYAKGDTQWQYRTTDWEWKDKQYQYKGAKPDMEQAIEYSGKVLLSDMMTDLLQQRLPESMDVGEHLSQALDSFSDALLMRSQCIQIPLLQNPDEVGALLPDNRFKDYLTTEAYFLPNVNAKTGNAANFFPVRAGHVQFTRLWVTDTFGQVKKVLNTDTQGRPIRNGLLQIAEELATTGDRFTVTLSPRVVQPANLSFRWCAANTHKMQASSNDPATTPVCGWLLPDYLDQSLEIYEEWGKKCGSLKMLTIDGRVQLQWHSPPGEQAASPQQRISNTHLLGFVNGLLNFRDNNDRLDGGEALRALFDLCNSTALFLATAAARQSPGLAGLMGQPVAVVRAALNLDLLGLPAQPQGFDHEITEASKANPPGLGHLSFPVTLGDSRNSKDGLIGYFIDEDSKGFGAMHIPYGMQKPNHPYFINQDVSLSFNATAEPTGITLLMDPRGGVQADAGILPTKFIDLPTAYTDKGLKHMELDMLIAPFLGSLDNPFIPLGSEPDRQWVLKQQTKDGWKETHIDNQTQLQTGSLNTQVIQEGYLSLLPAKPDKQ